MLGLTVDVQVGQLKVIVLVLFLELVDEASEATRNFLNLTRPHLVSRDELSPYGMVHLSEPLRVSALLHLLVVDGLVVRQEVPREVNDL